MKFWRNWTEFVNEREYLEWRRNEENRNHDCSSDGRSVVGALEWRFVNDMNTWNGGEMKKIGIMTVVLTEEVLQVHWKWRIFVFVWWFFWWFLCFFGFFCVFLAFFRFFSIFLCFFLFFFQFFWIFLCFFGVFLVFFLVFFGVFFGVFCVFYGVFTVFFWCFFGVHFLVIKKRIPHSVFPDITLTNFIFLIESQYPPKAGNHEAKQPAHPNNKYRFLEDFRDKGVRARSRLSLDRWEPDWFQFC